MSEPYECNWAKTQAYSFIKAMRVASLAHHDQVRLDGTPALWHPIDVVHLLQQHGIRNVSILCAGLLHDALEDNPSRREELRHNILHELGKPVHDWVVMLSDSQELVTSEARKAAQLRKMHSAPAEVRTIKLADRLANLLSGPAPAWSAAKCAAYVRHSRDLLHVAQTPHTELQRSIQRVLREPPWKAFDAPCKTNDLAADREA
ncbi:MAG: HD domain-containing protein [Azonexus sp.]